MVMLWLWFGYGNLVSFELVVLFSYSLNYLKCISFTLVGNVMILGMVVLVKVWLCQLIVAVQVWVSRLL